MASGQCIDIEFGINLYSKVVFLDEDGNQTGEEIPLPRLLLVDGQFIATPVCPKWNQAPEGGHPYPRIPEDLVSPMRYHFVEFMKQMSAKEEKKLSCVLRLLSCIKRINRLFHLCISTVSED